LSESAATGFPWFDAIVAILSAGGVGAALTAFFDYMTKKREQTFEMAKQKMQVVSGSIPLYIQLASYYSEFAYHLETANQTNLSRALYCASRIFSLHSIIFERYGSMQLDNLEAEQIITELELYIQYINFEDISTMQELVKDNPSYNDFSTRALKNRQFLKKFETILHQIKEEVLTPGNPTTRQKCRWYGQLVNLELNQIYQLWYKGLPILAVESLDKDLCIYLADNFPNYNRRIYKWVTGGVLK